VLAWRFHHGGQAAGTCASRPRHREGRSGGGKRSTVSVRSAVDWSLSATVFALRRYHRSGRSPWGRFALVSSCPARGATVTLGVSRCEAVERSAASRRCRQGHVELRLHATRDSFRCYARTLEPDAIRPVTRQTSAVPSPIGPTYPLVASSGISKAWSATHSPPPVAQTGTRRTSRDNGPGQRGRCTRPDRSSLRSPRRDDKLAGYLSPGFRSPNPIPSSSSPRSATDW